MAQPWYVVQPKASLNKPLSPTGEKSALHLWHPGQDTEQSTPASHLDTEASCHGPPRPSPWAARCSGGALLGWSAEALQGPPLPQSQAGQRGNLRSVSAPPRPASHLLFFKLLLYFLSRLKVGVTVSLLWGIIHSLSVSLYVYLLSLSLSLSPTSSLFLVTLCLLSSFSLSTPFLKPREVRSLRGSQNASIQYRDPGTAADFLGI